MTQTPYRFLFILIVPFAFWMCSAEPSNTREHNSFSSSEAQAKDEDRQDPNEENLSPYYREAKGKKGYELKKALSKIITRGHKMQSYHSLWQHFRKTDNRRGKVWDMYSDCQFDFGKDQDRGGNVHQECQKYNREHSFPKKWFGKNVQNAIYTDLFNIVPTDKKVNAMRGHYPFAEVKGKGDYTSSNGCKRGYPATKIPKYRGRVFEPADEYKGDFARAYFYMATRYQSKMDSWEHNSYAADAVLDGSEDRVYEPWLIELLYKWHRQDPVSQKERDRNEAIYKIQGNRNPFVDHPSWVTKIWNP